MIKFINLPRALCNHIIGEHHSVSHRLFAGGIVMVVGVSTAKTAVFFQFFPLHLGVDLIGYLIHAMGAVPYIELMMEKDHDSK